jgi:hypothetical protein
MHPESFSSVPGTYALLLLSPRRAEFEVGRQGCLRIKAGHYLYVGSAFCPGRRSRKGAAAFSLAKALPLSYRLSSSADAACGGALQLQFEAA